jgi:4-hydroxy-4-methyl-2-oxoglutarate aldolase
LIQSELTMRLSKLFSAVLCDVLDRKGFRTQAMAHEVRPLFPEARIIGTAKTLLSVRNPNLSARPYEKELEALDALQPGEVVIIGTEGDLSAGVWGELLSCAARAKGSVGAITDGLTRDAAGIREKKFPVFARGISPYDSYGRSEIVAYDVPVTCGGVRVKPGEIVFADFDGIVIVPTEVLDETLELAESKASGERIVDEEFRKGRRIADVFAEYGVL